MAFQLVRTIILGSAKAGLTLYAQLVDSAGSNVGSPVTTGFSERGTGSPVPPGIYLWNYSAFPDGFRGIVEYYDDADDQLLASEEINPEELNVSGTGAEAIADAFLDRNLAGGANGGRTVRSALRPLRNKRTSVAISATQRQMTVYAEDDTTIDHQAVVGVEAVNPATSVDPA